MDTAFLTAKQHDLRLPKAVLESGRSLVSHHQSAGAHRQREEAPFRRMADLWFAAVVWAEHGRLVADSTPKLEKFASVGPYQNDVTLDRWMLEILLLVSVRRLEPDLSTQPDPAEIFRLANQLAATGAPALLEAIKRDSDIGEPQLYTTVELFRGSARRGS